jgi:hypothetical protein
VLGITSELVNATIVKKITNLRVDNKIKRRRKKQWLLKNKS